MRALLSCLLASLLAGSAHGDSLPGPEKMALLRAGEILTEYTRMDESGGAVRGFILMHTAVENITAILQGCGKAFVFVDGMEQCEILEKDDDYTLIRQVVDTGLFAPQLDYSYRSESKTPSQMEFNLVEGNLRVLQGGWNFVEVDEGVLAFYDMRVRLGFPLPRFMVRMSLRRMIPDMLACVRGLVDGSGSVEQNEKDLEQCPGDV